MAGVWYKTLDWMINWVGFIFLFVCIGLIYADVEKPSLKVWMYNPLNAWDDKGAIGIPVLFVAMTLACTAALIVSQKNEGKNFEWRKFLIGFSQVLIFTMLSKWISQQQTIKKNSMGDSIWAIFFGCCLYHLTKRISPKRIHHLDLAKQTELYIATSLVLLVANYESIVEIIGNSVFIAWIDTSVLFVFFSYISVKLFKLRPKQSMILSGCTLICGSSAATAIRNSLKGKEKDQKDSILISSLLTIPCIILLPVVAQAIEISDDIAGSWFGGCVDSTGAVYATAQQFSNKAVTTAAVVKMVQNVLIAPFSVCIVAFYIKYQKQIDDLEEDLFVNVKQQRIEKNESKLKELQNKSQGANSKRGSKLFRTKSKLSKEEQGLSEKLMNVSAKSIVESELYVPINQKNVSQEQLTSSKLIAEQLLNNSNTYKNALEAMLPPQYKDMQEDQQQNNLVSKENIGQQMRISDQRQKSQQQKSRNNSEKMTASRTQSKLEKQKKAKEEEINKLKQQSYLMIIWEKFPKFVLGFIVSIIIFNLSVESKRLEKGRDFIFTVSEWFSTCSFISIGMSLQLSKGDGKQLMILSAIYLLIQMTDIIATLAMSYFAYHYFQQNN